MTNKQGRFGAMTQEEAAAYLKADEAAIEKAVELGQIVPYHTPGGHRRYSIRTPNEYLEKSKGDPD